MEGKNTLLDLPAVFPLPVFIVIAYVKGNLFYVYCFIVIIIVNALINITLYEYKYI